MTHSSSPPSVSVSESNVDLRLSHTLLHIFFWRHLFLFWEEIEDFSEEKESYKLCAALVEIIFFTFFILSDKLKTRKFARVRLGLDKTS